MIGEAVGAAFAKYGAIVGGLFIGTAAKYGLALNEGRRLTWKGAIADMLLLGMLGLLAIVISDAMNLTGNAKVLIGALAAVSSDRFIRLARDRFLKATDGQMMRLLPLPEHEAIMHVPAGSGEPGSIGIQVPAATARERMSSNLHRSYGDVRGPIPRDQQDQLDKLDQD